MAELVGFPTGEKDVQCTFRLEALEPDSGHGLHAYRASFTKGPTHLLELTYDFPYSQGCLIGHSRMKSLGRVLAQANKLIASHLEILPFDISNPEQRDYLPAAAYLSKDWIEIVCWAIVRKKEPLIKLHLLFNVLYMGIPTPSFAQFPLPYLWNSALLECSPQAVASFGDSFLRECEIAFLSRKRLGYLAADEIEE